MSVVAVKVYDKEIIMSADSIITHGSDKTPVGRGKIFEVNGMLIGTSGYASEGIHMALFAENHTPLAMDEREIRNEKIILIFDITDYTDTITVKMFVRKDQLDELKSGLKKGGKRHEGALRSGG